METYEFDTYEIVYFGENHKSSIVVQCYKRLNKVCHLIFQSGPVIDPDGTHPENGYAMIHFSYNDFNNIYPILLHEKPLFVQVDTTGHGALITNLSPVDREKIGQEEEL